VYEKSQA
jgi:CRP-like cAMP-binding protein